MRWTKEGPTPASEASSIAWVGWNPTTVDAQIAIEMTPMLKRGQAVSALANKAHAQNRHSVWPSGLTFGRYRPSIFDHLFELTQPCRSPRSEALFLDCEQRRSTAVPAHPAYPERPSEAFRQSRGID
jgi:hypothetical protein